MARQPQGKRQLLLSRISPEHLDRAHATLLPAIVVLRMPAETHGHFLDSILGKGGRSVREIEPALHQISGIIRSPGQTDGRARKVVPSFCRFLDRLSKGGLDRQAK